MKHIILLVFTIITFGCANDGAFYTEGNLLIPIRDSLIAVTKEVLTIDRINDDEVKVTVDYTFLNELNSTHTVLVGFEAMPPHGDVDGRPKDGAHPYISDFTVELNGRALNYHTAMVDDSLYSVKGNHVVGKSEEELIDNDFNENAPEFFYVYYFTANFSPGENELTHTYTFKLGSGIGYRYTLDYLLSPAARWKGSLIYDFTLKIDMGEFEEFYITPYWSAPSEWDIDGVIKKVGPNKYNPEGGNRLQVFTRGGYITYTCKNFYAEGGDLNITATYPISIEDKQDLSLFASTKHKLPFPTFKVPNSIVSVDEKSYKILRNLPFARRGYVFKTEFIQQYYESLIWYTADSTYIPHTDHLTSDELSWLQSIRKTKWLEKLK